MRIVFHQPKKVMLAITLPCVFLLFHCTGDSSSSYPFDKAQLQSSKKIVLKERFEGSLREMTEALDFIDDSEIVVIQNTEKKNRIKWTYIDRSDPKVHFQPAKKPVCVGNDIAFTDSCLAFLRAGNCLVIYPYQEMYFCANWVDCP